MADCECTDCLCKTEPPEDPSYVTYYRVWPSRADLLLAGGALLLFAIPVIYTLLT